VIRAILVAALLSVGLVAFYLDEGGGDFEVASAPGPCVQRPPEQGGGGGSDLTETGQRIALTALAGAACELRVSRERLLLSLAGQRKLPGSVTPEQRSEAFKSALRAAIDDEVRAGRLDETTAFAIRQAIEFLPIDSLVERFLQGATP
jgi:hypothetical protein